MSGEQGKSTYGRILKSSALLGASSLINVILGMIRVKVLAVELGPALFGVMTLYTSLTSMVGSATSLGLGQSAVRDIAKAAGEEDQNRIAYTASVLHKVVWLTGLGGLIVTVLVAYPASVWTFGNADHTWAIAILGITVLFSQLQAGQGALLSGLRKIRELAAINVIGGVWSTLLAIPLLLLFGQNGIVPFLLAVAAGQLATSWWYARRISLPKLNVSWRDCATESREMIRLGAAIVISGVALAASNYIIRLIIQQEIDEAAVGIYQSAFTISSIYVGFILQAMSGDYYPRLAGCGENASTRNRLVNEQAEIAILLAVPGLAAALVLAEPMIWLLYSDRFDGAAEILRWQILGMLGRIISWPIGFILWARADKSAFLWSELAATALHILLVWLGVKYFGAEGAGIAFAGQYLFHVILMTWITRTRHEHKWNKSTLKLVAGGIAFVGLVFVSTYVASPYWRYGLGTLLMVLTCWWSLHEFVQRLGKDKLLERFNRIKQKFM